MTADGSVLGVLGDNCRWCAQAFDGEIAVTIGGEPMHQWCSLDFRMSEMERKLTELTRGVTPRTTQQEC